MFFFQVKNGPLDVLINLSARMTVVYSPGWHRSSISRKYRRQSSAISWQLNNLRQADASQMRVSNINCKYLDRSQFNVQKQLYVSCGQSVLTFCTVIFSQGSVFTQFRNGEPFCIEGETQGRFVSEILKVGTTLRWKYRKK